MRNYIGIIVEAQRTTYTQDELAEYFSSPELYKKIGTVEARLATPDEWIATVIDGEIETTNQAGENDVVIKNPGGEHYIIGRGKFDGRYNGPELTKEYQTYDATGTTYAVQWGGDPAEFEASWGEMMIIDRDDFLCSPTETPDGDLYRVERNAFTKTYIKKAEHDDKNKD